MVFKAKASHILSVCFIFLFTSPCQPHCTPRLNTWNSLEASRGINNFGINLINELVKPNSKPNSAKNVAISSFSVHAGLGLTRIGAHGSTADEMDVGLGFHNKNTDEIAASYHYLMEGYQGRNDVKIANKLFINNVLQVQDKFQNLLTKRLFSPVDLVDFGDKKAHLTINNFVENKTNKLIKDLIPAGTLDSSTIAVIVNAIHFKGAWLHPFEDTFYSRFYLNEQTYFKAPTMLLERELQYVELPNLDARAVELPYKNSDLSFVVILPNSNTGLMKLLKDLQNTPLSDITGGMKNTKIELQMPKFKVEFQADLKEPLSNMGMSLMFSADADFRNMIRNISQIRISKVIHKTIIEVSEEGTEAASATGSVVVPLMASSTIPFKVNQPFYFAIKDNKDIKLFEGIINDYF